jgi:maleylpyruvate isomerase
MDWMRRCTEVLLAAVDGLPDDELDGATALPGWSRRHLVAHLGFNARALCRLAAWARTGVRTPMYASSEQRDREIADAAQWPADRLRELARQTAADLEADLGALGPQDWTAEVVTAQGRDVPATDIPWMRTREVAIHAVDLGTGARFGDLPEDLCEALVDDVAVMRSRRADGPALQLVASTGRTWAVAGAGTPARAGGTPAGLARWLTGRGAEELSPDERLPELPRWL